MPSYFDLLLKLFLQFELEYQDSTTPHLSFSTKGNMRYFYIKFYFYFLCLQKVNLNLILQTDSIISNLKV